MIAKSNFISKMSESNIVTQYSKYLQQAWVKLEEEQFDEHNLEYRFLLSYAEFKEYYIQQLVGKDNYLDSMVRALQFSI